MMKLKDKFKDGWPSPIFYKVTEANKGKSFSSRYLHTYNLCYILLPVITGDPYDQTQN